jgi:hypothetical protein
MLRIAASIARPSRTTRSIEVTAFSTLGAGAFNHRKHACAVSVLISPLDLLEE